MLKYFSFLMIIKTWQNSFPLILVSKSFVYIVFKIGFHNKKKEGTNTLHFHITSFKKHWREKTYKKAPLSSISCKYDSWLKTRLNEQPCKQRKTGHLGRELNTEARTWQTPGTCAKQNNWRGNIPKYLETKNEVLKSSGVVKLIHGHSSLTTELVAVYILGSVWRWSAWGVWFTC
jgi:hypothetical protein